MDKIIIQLVQIIYYQCCQVDCGWYLDKKSLKNAQIIAWYLKEAPSASQLMISFPQIRLKFKIRVFSNISIENFWAVIDKIRTRKNLKEKMCSLCCLFMSLASITVHLEMKFVLGATVFLSGI